MNPAALAAIVLATIVVVLLFFSYFRRNMLGLATEKFVDAALARRLTPVEARVMKDQLDNIIHNRARDVRMGDMAALVAAWRACRPSPPPRPRPHTISLQKIMQSDMGRRRLPSSLADQFVDTVVEMENAVAAHVPLGGTKRAAAALQSVLSTVASRALTNDTQKRCPVRVLSSIQF